MIPIDPTALDHLPVHYESVGKERVHKLIRSYRTYFLYAAYMLNINTFHWYFELYTTLLRAKSAGIDTKSIGFWSKGSIRTTELSIHCREI